MITKIDHIGIAVASLDERLPFWAEALGMEVGGTETVSSERVRVAWLAAGGSRIELLEATADDSTVAKFVAKRGEGIHHLTLAVGDLDAALERLDRHGAPTLGGARSGAGGSRVAFLHPRSAGGVLIELVERPAARTRVQAEIRTGEPVVAYLREPQEKVWGVLRRLDAGGAVIEGIDLGSFDDWVAQVARRETSVVGPSVVFFPARRLDKLVLDQSSGELPSLAQRFESRTGRTLAEVLADRG